MSISGIKTAIDAIAGFNECVNFFQWVKSLWSHSNGEENEEQSGAENAEQSGAEKDDVRQFEGFLHRLRDTLPIMRDFIDRAEWRSHQKCVAELLPKLKDAMYDAEDLVEDFKCYEQKVGSGTSAEAGTKSFHNFIQHNFNKLTQIHKRLENQLSLLKGMGLHKEIPRFDSSVRPTTPHFSTEARIFGRDATKRNLIELLGVSKGKRSPPSKKRKRSRMTRIPVLPITGIGGVGKTTLAQTICNDAKVNKHFDKIVWICVSDDFDVKRLTKEAIEQFSGTSPAKDNLKSLQDDLANRIKEKRFLIVLDDMWEEKKEPWKTFYEPFKRVHEGSMMLVTTRSEMVAGNVRHAMDKPFPLEGLEKNAFRMFFKQCVFGSDASHNSPELESIGEQILLKLKGIPLAAKTIGRLLGSKPDLDHWRSILSSELWEIPQEGTDILPALRLSYIYLKIHLKRCFSFCAVFQKDYKFVKEDLAEIWVAEGFVKPEGNKSLQQTACDYFEELADLSFFQKLHGKYVIHDLLHDMAQLVSKGECFIIKEKKDLERIPQNVRHLSVVKSGDVDHSDLENLCKYTKLRTILCDKSLKGPEGNNVMEKWCAELLCLRLMVCASISKSGLPDSISNMKSLRYLKISNDCSFHSLPAAFCHLYNLQVLSAKKCSIKVIPEGFSNLINLQKFESKFLNIDARLLNNFNLIAGKLCICNLCEISKDQAAKIELMKKSICSLTLVWSKGISPEHKEIEEDKEIEVFQALHPPTNIKSVCLKSYPCESLQSWSHGSEDPTIFSSLKEITVTRCPRLSSLEQFLQPAYMPAIKKMVIKNCTSLKSVPVERFGVFSSLEDLDVLYCPKISQNLQAPSLKQLKLRNSGNLGDDIDCRSLTTFHLSLYLLTSLTFNREKVPLLTELTIAFCGELETLNGSWPNLKTLSIKFCPRLKWEDGIVLPLSLQNLYLEDCGYFSTRCLENLMSLKSLEMCACKHIESIPRDLWSSSLKSLQELKFWFCKDLVSIGGLEAIAHIPKVNIQECPELKEVQQPLKRGY